MKLTDPNRSNKSSPYLAPSRPRLQGYLLDPRSYVTVLVQNDNGGLLQCLKDEHVCHDSLIGLVGLANQILPIYRAVALLEIGKTVGAWRPSTNASKPALAWDR